MHLGNIDIKYSITFEQATQLANVESGDSMSVALGKLSKLYATLENTILNSDLKPNSILQTNNTGKISSSDISKDLLKNLKMVQFGSEETKTTLFVNASLGITPISTNESTPYQELPSGAPEWKYATGMILKRTNEVGDIVLYSYLTGKVGIVSTGNSGQTWSEWSIDKEDITELQLALNPSNFDFKLKKYIDRECSSHIEVLQKYWNEAFEDVPAAGGYRVILTHFGTSDVVWTCFSYHNKLYGYALCFSHPNDDVSSPQFYTISNGTWSDRNELISSKELFVETGEISVSENFKQYFKLKYCKFGKVVVVSGICEVSEGVTINAGFALFTLPYALAHDIRINAFYASGRSGGTPSSFPMIGYADNSNISKTGYTTFTGADIYNIHFSYICR